MIQNHNRTRITRSRSARALAGVAGLVLVAALGCEVEPEPQAVNPETPPSERDDAQQTDRARPTAGTGGNSTLGKAKNAAGNIANRMEEKSKETAEKYGNPYGNDR